MAKKRFTDVEIWSKEWFMDLSPKLKCLIRYLFDNCDSSGVWTPNWRLASMQIGESVCLDDLKKLPEKQYEILEAGKIFLPDFISFQYGKLSEASPAHKPVFRDIEKNRLSDRVFNRVSNTLQEKETEKDKEVDKEITFGKSENLLIPKMIEAFLILFPKYPKDQKTDFPALREIAEKIQKTEGFNGDISHNTEHILKRWGEIIVHIKSDNHLSKYSISQVNKHFQSVIQSLSNGSANRTANKSKPGTSEARTNTAKGWGSGFINSPEIRTD